MSSPAGLPHPVDGVEQRLDAILAELQALRMALAPAPVSAQDGTVELREPERRAKRRER